MLEDGFWRERQLKLKAIVTSSWEKGNGASSFDPVNISSRRELSVVSEGSLLRLITLDPRHSFSLLVIVSIKLVLFECVAPNVAHSGEAVVRAALSLAFQSQQCRIYIGMELSHVTVSFIT